MKFRFGLMASVGFVGLCINAPSIVNAADMPPPPPPPPSYVEVVNKQPSCLYGRVDGGATFHKRPTVTKNTAGGIVSATDEKVHTHGFVEAGVGCQFTDNMRVEVVGGYRFKKSITDPFNSLDMKLTTYTGFVNAFWDITNYNGFTPYLGAGVGFAHHRLSNVVLPANSASGNRTDLAYNVTAGIAYDLTTNLKLDAAYRYVDLGAARSKGTEPTTVDDLRAHEFKVGLRYQWSSW